MPSGTHVFYALAFVENIPLKELAQDFPEARRKAHELSYAVPAAEPGGAEGRVFVYPFGAVAFRDVPAPRREAELARLRAARTVLTDAGATEEMTVREDECEQPDVAQGVLILDRMTPDRASVVALTIAQSAAMEYYERIVEEMSLRTDRIVQGLEARGTVSLRTRPLHRFIGTATATRNEVINILHLLDKPDEAWDDPGMDRIYDELKAEFDLVDRYGALEAKLRSVQESLGLVLDVARDRRLVLLEVTVILLILFELVLALARVL
ncbi:MAG TPA: RMD1 family protein [Polyangiaceae bacterium]|nr:RMD1 family protein [Polyangiaceae bacterium]